MSKGTIFFDFDGTLHDSMKLYAPALRTAYAWLVEQGVVEPREFADDEICGWLGWAVEDMWTVFVPGIEEKTWRTASKIVADEMNDLLRAGKGTLFPGIPEVLVQLKDEGFNITFLSNCGRSYCNEYLATFGVDHLFDATYCAAEFDFIPKWQIYQQVAAAHPQPHIMVGDRFHDMEVATHAGIPSIGCTYGYGKPAELEIATRLAAKPSDIPLLIHELTSTDRV